MRRLTLVLLLAAAPAQAQPLTWSLADGNDKWPANMRDTISKSMDEAVALYNRYGTFEKHLTANYNDGVPTAQGNYDGWIDFGSQYNTRTALHEIAHALGVGTYRPFNGGQWDQKGAAGKLEKLYDGQGATLSTGGTHFWPYGLNYDNEDGSGARERHCKLIAALRLDMGIVRDSDSDGMPDDWETLYFGDLKQEGGGDADKDGITNADEYASDGDPKQACPVRDGRAYVLRAQISDRALTFTDKARIVKNAQKNWTFRYVGEGFWRIEDADGEVLQLEGTDTRSGKPLSLASWTSALSQQWRIVSGPAAKNDYFQIANRETGRVMDCLDGAENAEVQQYPYLGNLPQQYWTFDELPNLVVDAGTAMVDASVRDASVVDAFIPLVLDARVPAVFDDAGSAEARPESDGCTLSSRHSNGTFALVLLAMLWRRRRHGT